MTEITPDRLKRYRATLENMRQRKRDMIQKGLLTNVPTRDTTNNLLTAILDTIQTEEEKFEQLHTRWPHLVAIVPPDDETEIAEWLQERGAFGIQDNVYGFDDPDLAFEFKMRWGGRA